MFSSESTHIFNEFSHLLEDASLSIFERGIAPSVGRIDFFQVFLGQELKDLDMALCGCHVQCSSSIVVRGIQVNVRIVSAEKLKAFEIAHGANVKQLLSGVVECIFSLGKIRFVNLEQVEGKHLRKLGTELDSFGTVAILVKWRSVSANSHDARDDRDNCSADS